VRVQHDPRFDWRTAKAVGDGPGAAVEQEVAKAFVLAPEIKRGIFVLDCAETAALAQQERLEVELRNGVPQLTAPARAVADDLDVVIGGQPMNVVSDDDDFTPVIKR
jgi:hypothetical protein